MIREMVLWFAGLALAASLATSYLLNAQEVRGANQFHEYCSKCHALPDRLQVRARWDDIGEYMLLYIRGYGATQEDADAIREYIEVYMRDENE